MKALFDLGTVLTTAGIAQKMKSDLLFRVGVQQALGNHAGGDWGIIPDGDKEQNEEAIRAELAGEPTDRLMSAYRIGETEIWIITEYDRSVTTVLLPDEY